ncbi:MAG: lytic murein transglycosylase [Nitrospirota bacterium]|nr:lytic murein transglycosylase [Nitrospirota bacterium]
MESKSEKNNSMKPLFFILIALVLYAVPAQGNPGFDRWVTGVKAEARQRGISSTLLDQAFRDVEPLPRVLELDRNQPESTMTFLRYKKHIVSSSRIKRGRHMMTQHRDMLQEVGQYYGVQPRFIVALWGIETNYGSNTGGFNTIGALATLAYDGRRSRYFRKELLNALQILQEGHSSPSTMKGSWAGALGQSQFMPSSFLRFAVDYDGDGRKDIWTTPADVFASAANYLSRSGWRGGENWGRRAKLPPGFNMKQATLKIKKPLQAWQRYGVRRGNGRSLPQANMKGSIVLPDGTKDPAYLVYHNFRVIMKWNRSTYFATSVGLLADAIGR